MDQRITAERAMSSSSIIAGTNSGKLEAQLMQDLQVGSSNSDPNARASIIMLY
jgi:hypothetical protein